MSTESNQSDTGVTPPGQDRVGNDFSEGANPTPGGDIDTSGSTLPPYEGRSSGSDFPEGTQPEAAGGDPSAEGGRTSPDPAQTPGGATASPADEQPAAEATETVESDPGVGPAHVAGTNRGEDLVDTQGSEPGREHTGTDDQGGTDRPMGESDNRDQTSIDPSDGNTDRTAG